MRIGYIERCNCLPEREAFSRFKYVFEAQGDEFYFLDLHGFSQDCGIYADDLNLDFCIVTDFTDLWQRQLPNCPCVFLKWVPSGYLPFWYNKGFFYKIINFDFCLSNCTTDDTKNVLYMCGDDKIFYYKDKYIVASPSSSLCIPPKKTKNKKLFYAGINSEKRYETLFKKLDADNIISLYGYKNGWTGFNNYNGEIPADGVSVLKKINEIGICLALISKEHYRTGHITSRLWEGLAAGAVIITTHDKQIENDFGNNLYYLNPNLSEEELYRQIRDFVKEINQEMALNYEKAVNAQKIFKKKYSAEQMVHHIKDAFIQVKSDLANEGNEWVDIIAYIDSKESFVNIIKNVQSQTYKNKFVHFITTSLEFIDKAALSDLCYEIYKMPIENRGKAFARIRHNLKGVAFAFIDGNSYWQFRFLYKMKRILDYRKLEFVYSGTFYKNYDREGKIKSFDYLLTENITIDDFLSPLKNKNFHEEDYLYFEECFSLGSVLFSKKILQDCDDIRLSIFYNSPHIYLAVKALLCNRKAGDFARVYCSGYERMCTETGDKAIHSSRFFRETGRPGTLTSVAVLNAFVSDLELIDNINIDNTKNVTPLPQIINEEAQLLYAKSTQSVIVSYIKLKVILLKIRKIFSITKRRRQKDSDRIKKLEATIKYFRYR